MEFLLYPIIGTDSKKKYWFFSDLGTGNYTNLGYEHNVGEFETIFPVNWLTSNNKLWAKQGWSVAKKTDINYTFTVYSAGTVSPIYYQYEKLASFPTQSVGIDIKSCNVVYANRIFPKKILSGDFNGDGLTDVIAIDQELSSIIKGTLCMPKQSILTSKKVYFVNLKRDVISDIVTYSGELLTNLSSASRVEVADLNGDGKSDFLIFENGKATSYTLNDVNQLVLLWDYTDTNISVDISKTILLGDYNGDGKTDFIVPKVYGSTEWYKYTSTGSNFLKEVQNYIDVPFNQSTTTSTYNYTISDYDKDGKSDLVLINTLLNTAKTQGSIFLRCYINKNGSFSGGLNNGSSVSEYSTFSPDIKLNTLPIYLPTRRGITTKYKPYEPTMEIAFLGNNKIFYFNTDKDHVQDQLLRSIRTANGVTESITYKPLNSDYDEEYNTIYSSSYSETYPNSNIESASSMQVVSMLEKQSATDYKKQLYSYYDAISNVNGLGFLGFKAAAKTNWFDDNNPIMTTVSNLIPICVVPILRAIVS